MVGKWIGTNFAQLAYLLAQATDAGERGTTWVFEAHFIHHGVYLSWEDAHDGERSHVETDACPRLEFMCGESGSVRDDVTWSRRSFHDN
jgi:hypothetical protein